MNKIYIKILNSITTWFNNNHKKNLVQIRKIHIYTYEYMYQPFYTERA